MSNKLFDERRDYQALSLNRGDLSNNPYELFAHWLQSARDANIIDATAMTLATVDANNQPHARIVLLKDFSEQGFTFFTNNDSAKGDELRSTPKACLLFYWQKFERQVRISGPVSQVSREVSETYFYSRPLESRFSAAASKQSSPVAGREQLQSQVDTLHTSYPDGNVPCPESWTGYCVEATQFEFWQGRSNRLHDRFQYTLNTELNWQATRLNP